MPWIPEVFSCMRRLSGNFLITIKSWLNLKPRMRSHWHLGYGDEHERSNNQMFTKVALQEICHKYMHILVQIVFYFILYFYIFLFWRDWTHVLAESQSSVKHVFMQIFPGHFTFILPWIIERLDRKLADVIGSNIVEKCDVTLSRAIQPLTSDVLSVFN